MLYIDGMQGVMRSESTIEWLYSLLGSKYAQVAKTAIKLLLLFVEYMEANCAALVRAVTHYHQAHGTRTRTPTAFLHYATLQVQYCSCVSLLISHSHVCTTFSRVQRAFPTRSRVEHDPPTKKQKCSRSVFSVHSQAATRGRSR